MKGYKATIGYVNRELSIKEKISIKDTSDAIKIDDVTSEVGELIINPDVFAEINVHNENVRPDSNGNVRTDYAVYVIIADDGQKYVTSSESFWSTFRDIYDEVMEAGEEFDFGIKCYRKPSKNFKGKDFLTCSIA